MPTAGERLERWIAAGPGDGGLDAVRVCLDADLDTPGAIAAIDAAAAGGAGVSAAAALLGVDTATPVMLDPPDPALVSWRARL
jgi:L-cysteine:1D-myo-inositol 2-amino-2-deoxy-alpha-D-glucopyranoside ligase